jgi:hypothetical protein
LTESGKEEIGVVCNSKPVLYKKTIDITQEKGSAFAGVLVNDFLDHFFKPTAI